MLAVPQPRRRELTESQERIESGDPGHEGIVTLATTPA
jgi:hypothetical protein